MISITRDLLTHIRTRPALRPNGSAYRIRNVKAIVVHWTANTSPKADAKANRSYFNQGFRSASAHYIVDSNTVLQCIPDTEVSFNCGDKPEGRYRPAGLAMVQGTRLTPNYFTIGVEMCVNSDGDFAKTQQLTIELCARLLIKHRLTPDQLLRHFDVTGKKCPKPFLENIPWLEFKIMVIEVWKQLLQSRPHNELVSTKTLNVRSGYGVEYPVLYELYQGEPVTIFEMAPNGWARIGEGEWVNAKFLTSIL